MRAVNKDEATLEIHIELLIQGKLSQLDGVGRFEHDLQLGQVLRVEMDDPLGGSPEFLFPLDCIQRDESFDLRRVAQLRLRVDLSRGTVIATIE